MTSTAPQRKRDRVTAAFVQRVRERLAAGLRVRRALPAGGRVAIDRPLPYLVVYRRPPFRPDAGTDRLVTAEAAYLTCSGASRQLAGLRALVRATVEELHGAFGAVLLLEVWSGEAPATDGPLSTADLAPRFRLLAPRRQASQELTGAFVDQLARIRLRGRAAEVTVARPHRRTPRKMPRLLAPEEETRLGCHSYGLEVTPVYRSAPDGDVFPRVLRDLRHRLSLALRRTAHEFATRHTTHRPPHFHALGRRATVKAVWEVDRQLADLSERFDLLLLVTPLNAEPSWHEFRRSGYRRAPALHYRPVPWDPVELKRRLYATRVERVEDPALAAVFRERIIDLDRQITMLHERGTSRFLHESIQLFGGVGDGLRDLALQVLAAISPRARERAAGPRVSPTQFALRAEQEIAYLRKQHPALAARVEIRPDVTSLMVSHGNLLISRRSAFPASRVDALLQHEVGTHVLTYHNGAAQPLRQLASGLAGYDALQEGLAVLAEYLAGGLSRPRLRLLAGRVVAARYLLGGATFGECFGELWRTHGFSRRTAFGMTVRTYRGGGLTKDAVYLRGLRQALAHFAGGGELEPLLVGKIAARHVPLIRELQWRGVLRPAPIRPRYLDDPMAQARLERLRGGLSVLELCKRSTR